MKNFQMAPLFLLIGGFLLGAVISEKSLKQVSEAEQGALMVKLAPLRQLHIFAFPAIALATYFFHVPFWPALATYFAISVVVIWSKLKGTSLPHKLVLLQVASVGIIFCSALVGWIWSSLV